MIFGASSSRHERNERRRRREAEREARRPAEASDELPPKLIPSLRALFSTGTSLLHTRLALAGVELEEEVQRLIGALVLALVALVAILLALIVGTFAIVVAVSPEYRVATMLIITAVYFVLAVLLVLRIRSVFQGRPPIFGATLAELEKDKATWSEMARTQDLAEELAAVRARAARVAHSRTSVLRRPILPTGLADPSLTRNRSMSSNVPLKLRKEMLLMRAAVERIELAQHMMEVRQAATLSAIVRNALPSDRSRSLMSRALETVKRYPFIASAASLLATRFRVPLLASAAKWGGAATVAYKLFELWKKQHPDAFVTRRSLGLPRHRRPF